MTDAELTELDEINDSLVPATTEALKCNLGGVLFTNKNILGLYLSGHKPKRQVFKTVEKVKQFYFDHKEAINRARELCQFSTQDGWIEKHIDQALSTNIYQNSKSESFSLLISDGNGRSTTITVLANSEEEAAKSVYRKYVGGEWYGEYDEYIKRVEVREDE